MERVGYNKAFKSSLLLGIAGRLRDEYIPILNFLIEYSSEHERKIGFWSLPRIIFPVIEEVADILNVNKEDFLSEKLKVDYGWVYWMIYRNGLLHGEQPHSLSYKGIDIDWALSLRAAGHRVDYINGAILLGLDLNRLYHDLLGVVDAEAKKEENKVIISYPIFVEIKTKDNSKLIRQLEELISRH